MPEAHFFTLLFHFQESRNHFRRGNRQAIENCAQRSSQDPENRKYCLSFSKPTLYLQVLTFQIEATVEKSIKQASSRRSTQEKAKKTSHHLAADLEKVMKTFAQESRRTSKLLSEKQTAKVNISLFHFPFVTRRYTCFFSFQLCSKRAKLEESSTCADQVYHDATMAAESQRQELELVLTAAALRIETLEETRLANLQTALGRYHCHLSQLGPGLTNVSTICYFTTGRGGRDNRFYSVRRRYNP